MAGKADAVIGLRRVGKTSLLFSHLAGRISAGAPPRSHAYVNFEDDRLAGVGVEHLEALERAFLHRGVPGEERWFYLDEIQNAPGWERFVRRLVETPGYRVALTGSSSKALSAEIATAMRGRSLTTELFPFSFREALVAWGIGVPTVWPVATEARAELERAFDPYLARGGLPELLHADERVREALARGLVDVVLLRDVAERHAVGQLDVLRALVRRVLAAPGGAFTVNKAVNDLRSQGLGASREVVAAWMGHLEEAFLWFSVPIATDSERKRATNPRRVYPVDVALSAIVARTRSENLGWRLEQLVAVALRRRGFELGWARTASGFEVDFVARGGSEVWVVQVAWDVEDEATRTRELRALAEAAAEHGASRALLVTRGAAASWRAGAVDVEVVPAWAWLLEG